MIFNVLILLIFCKNMESSYDIIKTRLKTILQSERTIEFLNKLTDFGISLNNSPQINNKFIKEVFQGEGIEIENKHNRKKINKIIIDNKKILLRTTSLSNKFIIRYEIQDQIDFSNLKNEINNDLNNFDYLFLIRTEEDYNEELDELKVCYNYYLFPSKYFRIKENFPLLNKTSFSGERWLLKNFKEFYFKYDLENLISFNICLPYISY